MESHMSTDAVHTLDAGKLGNSDHPAISIASVPEPRRSVAYSPPIVPDGAGPGAPILFGPEEKI